MFVLYAETAPGEQRVALTENDVLTEYYIHRPAAPDGYGDLYWARVISVVPAMAGAFLALPGAEAFLPESYVAVPPTVGDHLPVRITRAGQGGKGPRVTARLSDAEQALAAPGAVRLLGAGPSPLAELQTAYPAVALRTGPLPDHLAAEIEGLASPAITLPGGMTGTITPTPALTAIDLDSGAATAARAPKQAAQFAANRAALPELARQIRLRNLSGAILIDLAGLPTKRRAALAGELSGALAGDRLGPRLVGFSGLGFAEILRPRLRPPLHERLRGPHATGLAALREVLSAITAAPSRRLVLRAAPAVIAALQADAVALADLAHLTTHPLVLRSDPILSGHSYTIEDALA